MIYICEDCNMSFKCGQNHKQCPFCGSETYRLISGKEFLEFSQLLAEAISDDGLERTLGFFEESIVHHNYFTCLMPASAFGVKNGMVIEVSIEYDDPDPEDDNLISVDVWAVPMGADHKQKLFLTSLAIPESPKPDISILEVLKESRKFKKIMRGYIIEEAGFCFDDYMWDDL